MEKIISDFKNLDTASVSDAMDKLGIPCGLHGIKPIANGLPICGRAFTVHYVPCGIKKGTVGDFLDVVKEGEVIVIDNGGRTYCTVWGDIMTTLAKHNGVGGTLIDGVCRDVPLILKERYPIYSKGYYMVTGKDRVEVDAVNIPVSLSGIKVNPGDIIMADESGAIVIPQEMETKILEIATMIQSAEEKIVEEVIVNGSTLKEAREKLHYHSLQKHVKN